MKKHLSTIVFIALSGVVFGQCLPATAHANLDVNNVSARINSAMGHFWDEQGTAAYEVPKGSGKHSLYASALWLGGLDINGQLRLAAIQFRQDGDDFWPGPVSVDGGATVSPETCAQYDRIWKLDRWQVAEFRERLGQPGYEIPQDILDWPAHGDVSAGLDYNLAPFKDVNGDGAYDPYDGDYPAFVFEGEPNMHYDLLGDQVLWWIANDKGDNHTESGGTPIGVELHCMAYAFKTCDALNDQTFYRYTLINRGNHTLNESYVGLWADIDIGFQLDDYVGCDVVRGLGYGYNGLDMDGTGGPAQYGLNPPAVGLDILSGPWKDYDGLDNDGDGIADNETHGMSKFIYFNNDGSVTGNPDNAQHYYNYMRGVWKDGTPLCYGGNGHPSGGGNPGMPCHYMFPGDSDPWGIGTGGNPQMQWTEQTAGNVAADRRFMVSSGPFTFQPGGVHFVHWSVVWARDTVNEGAWASIPALQAADDIVQSAFDSDFQNLECCPPAAAITYQNPTTFRFLFSSIAEGTSYSWDFGDGQTSTERFPTHTYAAYGTYNACLTVTNACGTDIACQQMVLAPPPLGVQLTRIEGTGNMGRSLDFVDGTHNSLFASSEHRIYHPKYDFHKGPVRIEVLDSTLLPAAEMVIALNGVTPEAGWKMYPIGGSDTVFSSSTIGVGDAQLVAQWGLLVQAKQVAEFDEECNVVLDCSIDHSTTPWITWLNDTELPHYSNWIRSGTVDTYYYNSNIADYGDPAECFENILHGTWAPWKLASHDDDMVSPTWSRFKALNKLNNLSSVDIVITPDRNRWTRCPVVEIADDSLMAIGDARRFDLRQSPSVDKNGNPDGSGTLGMGWFPGYAVNVETGERLNMAFGENTWFQSENGADMVWNPTSTVETPLGEPVLGGGHYIYVFGHNANSPVDDVPLYDEGQFMFQKLSSGNYVPADFEKRKVYKDAMWVGIPMLTGGAQLLQSAVTVKLRVSRPYADYECLDPVINSTHPMYSFFTSDLSTSVGDGLTSDLGLHVYPNPTDGLLMVELANRRPITALELFSTTGSLLQQQGAESSAATRQMDLGQVPAGIYFLVVHTQHGAAVSRLVVQ